MSASSGLGSMFVSRGAAARPSGSVEFVDMNALSMSARSQGFAGWLEVQVPPPPWRRSKLRDVVEAAIEQALDERGAPRGGVSGLADLDATLSDQLYRMRSIGVQGIALHVPSLLAATGLAGALGAEDSAVLRWWIEATFDRPVRLLLDPRNRQVGAYGPPTRLELLVGPAVQAFGQSEQGRTHDGVHVQIELDVELPLEATDGAQQRADAARPDEAAGFVADEHPDHTDDQALPSALATATTAAAPTAAVAPAAAANAVAPAASGPAGVAATSTTRTATTAEHHEAPSAPRFGRLMVPRHPTTSEPPASAGERHTQLMSVFPRREAASSATPRSAISEPSIDWRSFASDLELARGPKPLATVERLFMSRYVPLLESVSRGETDEPAQRTVEQWADNFARSYTEGFSALKVTGKRPRMVLDAPQLCNQIARLHGAKSTQLILVDGMRFDVGVRVQERMARALASRATCTERLLLWAALPTTTPAQLDLLARGPEGLTSPGPPGDGEELGVRGRTSATLRRVKIGARDVLKLDAVESRLRESGPALGERLDAMADEVAQALSAHARSQPPRTLMFIFGDHGFRMESDEVGTCAATTGGASPEEVLVPAFAWLIGDTH